MKTRQAVDRDVSVTFDADFWEIAAAPSGTRRGPPLGGLTGAPVAMDDKGALDAETAWLVDRLQAEPGVSTRALPTLTRRPGTPARALEQASAPVVTVELADDESAALLVECEGVVGWQFPDALEPFAGGSLMGRRSAGARQVQFTVIAPGGAAATTPAQRNVFSDWLLGRLKAVVLKFVARKTAGAVVDWLERDKRTGPVVLSSIDDPAVWQRPQDFSELRLSRDPPRVLLFVHGTFSSTVGGFGDLCATRWGQALLAEAQEKYDALIGYDHRTLSVDPLDNARGLYDALRTLAAPSPPTIDIVCHSRGGLVTRALIEKILPGAPWQPQIGRVIFAAATNAGTELARPGNWHALVDLMTNLALAGKRALTLIGAPQAGLIAGEIVAGIGDFVRYLVDAAVAEKRAPGLAAMDPDGEFVRDINRAEAGAPRAEACRYFAIESNFQAVLRGDEHHEPEEFPRRLALLLANGFIDTLMKKVRNDLVVHVDSMTAIDQVAGDYVKGVRDYGTNPLVYHTNYFIRPETVDSMAEWLELASPGAVEAVEAARFRDDIVVVDATQPVGDALSAARARSADFIVIRRQDPRGPGILHYAPTVDEVARHASRPLTPIGDALELHEWQQSATVHDRGALPGKEAPVESRASLPTFARRAVVVDGGEPAGVLPAPGEASSLAVLRRAAMPAARQTRGRSRGRLPESREEAQLGEAAPPSSGPVVCNARAEMPPQVAVGAVATVTVTLSADALAPATGLSASGNAELDPSRSVILEVIPKVGFELQSAKPEDSRIEFPRPPAAGAPFVVDVNVVATHAGPGEVWAIVRQGPVRALTLVLRPQVVAGTAARGNALATSGSVAAVADLPQVATLDIFQQRNGDETRFSFHVDIPGVAFNRFESPRVTGDIGKWVETLYKGIESAWLGSAGNREMFHDGLKAKGAELFRQLVPTPLKELLWRLHLNGKLASLLVHSDEPFVPWEIAYLDDPQSAGHAKACFFGQLGLCRWLYGAPMISRMRLRRDRLRYVVPHYPDPRYRLQAAETVEESMLVAMSSQRIEPHYAQVKAALAAGGFDLLHFAGHGGAESGSIGEAALLLEGSYQNVDGERRYVTEPLSADIVRSNAKLRDADDNRPLVVLNACQVARLGFSLTSIGGFAPAFLGVREGESDAKGEAGAFVSSLWSVGDQPASDFAQAFYNAMRAPGGTTFGRAVIAAREAARQAGDATWLAYAVYAHPGCRIELLP